MAASKVHDGEDTIASTRDARAPQKSRRFETRSLPALTRSYPRQLYVDRSHCPRPHASYLAALPSTRAISQTRVFHIAHRIRSIQATGTLSQLSCCYT